MRKILFATVATAAVLAPGLTAQKSLLFSGRFNFTSLDVANERPGGSINDIKGFDVVISTPNASTPFFARSFWLTTTAHAALMGDAYADGNYTRFETFPDNFDIAGVFVRAEDQADCSWQDVFWTVRDAVAFNLQAYDNNASSTVTIERGDFVRVTGNGNLDHFITQQLIMKAAGMQNGTFAPGASAICQDAAGNLYYSPTQGGHFVSGNTGTPQYRYDGAIIMIRRADITYQNANSPFGNVVDVVADSAFCLFDEVLANPPTVREMLANAGALNYNGGAITITNNVVGLALDPNGGTITAALADRNNVFETVPNFIWTDDGGTTAGTIWSTAINPANNNPGSIAVINGVRCGDDIVAATGVHTGCQLGTFTPTLMGLAVIDTPSNRPFLCDAPDFGAIPSTATIIDIDFWNDLPTAVTAVLSTGPLAPGQVPLAIDASFLLGPNSWQLVFGLTTQFATIPVGATNAFGYASLSFPRPMARLTGLPVIVHGIALVPPSIRVSNPCMLQFK